MGARVEPVNWQVTTLGDVRVIFVLYHYKDSVKVEGQLHIREGYRAATYTDGRCVTSSGVLEE